MSDSSEERTMSKFVSFFQESLAKKKSLWYLKSNDLKTRCAHLKRRSCKCDRSEIQGSSFPEMEDGTQIRQFFCP